jgi:hypothetical protein
MPAIVKVKPVIDYFALPGYLSLGLLPLFFPHRSLVLVLHC